MVDQEKLLTLDFHYIEEIRHGSGVYERKYAKDIACSEDTKAHVVGPDVVCFMSQESDHACCISIKNILCK